MENRYVRCFRINAWGRRIEEVREMMPVDTQWNSRLESQYGTDPDSRSESIVTLASGDRIRTVLKTIPSDLTQSDELIEYGFRFALSSGQDGVPQDYLVVVGDAMLVAYRETGEPGRSSNALVPVDVPWELDSVKARILQWTDGERRSLPQFSVSLVPTGRFAREYALHLRLENHKALYLEYGTRLDKPTRSLTEQAVLLTYAQRELMIIIGRVRRLDEETRLTILRMDESMFRHVDTITLPASDVPMWLRNRLHSFFRVELAGHKSERLLRVSRARRSGQRERIPCSA